MLRLLHHDGTCRRVHHRHAALLWSLHHHHLALRHHHHHHRCLLRLLLLLLREEGRRASGLCYLLLEECRLLLLREEGTATAGSGGTAKHGSLRLRLLCEAPRAGGLLCGPECSWLLRLLYRHIEQAQEVGLGIGLGSRGGSRSGGRCRRRSLSLVLSRSNSPLDWLIDDRVSCDAMPRR